MISIEKCRKILHDSGEDWNDEDIATVRELIYLNAKIIFEIHKKENDGEEI